MGTWQNREGTQFVVGLLVCGLALAACEPRTGCGDDDAGSPSDDVAVVEDAPSDDDDAHIEPPSLVVIDHHALDLGTACVGWPPTTATVQLANAGTARVDVAARLEGAQAEQFRLGASTCTTGLAGGSFCATVLEGAFSASSSVSADLLVQAGTATWTVPITVRVAHCDFAQLRPSSFDFGTLAIGERSAAQTFSIVNPGGVLGPPFRRAVISGTTAAEFELVRDGCSGHALAPTASCELEVVFAPTIPGAKAASLDLEGDWASSVSLTGTTR